MGKPGFHSHWQLTLTCQKRTPILPPDLNANHPTQTSNHPQTTPNTDSTFKFLVRRRGNGNGWILTLLRRCQLTTLGCRIRVSDGEKCGLLCPCTISNHPNIETRIQVAIEERVKRKELEHEMTLQCSQILLSNLSSNSLPTAVVEKPFYKFATR